MTKKLLLVFILVIASLLGLSNKALATHAAGENYFILGFPILPIKLFSNFIAIVAVRQQSLHLFL